MGTEASGTSVRLRVRKGRLPQAQGSPRGGQGSGGAAELAGYRLVPRGRVLLLHHLCACKREVCKCTGQGGAGIRTLAERLDRALGLGCENQRDSQGRVCVCKREVQRQEIPLCQEVVTQVSHAPPFFLPLSRFSLAVLHWKL